MPSLYHDGMTARNRPSASLQAARRSLIDRSGSTGRAGRRHPLWRLIGSHISTEDGDAAFGTCIKAWYGLTEIEIALADAGMRAYPDVNDRVADVRAALAHGLPVRRLAVLLGIGVGDLLRAIECSVDVDLRSVSTIDVKPHDDSDVIVLP